MEIITKSAQETQKLGKKIGNILISSGNKKSPRAFVITLRGELGSGKTTFVKGLTQGLGIPHQILSPTFIIMKGYPIKNNYFQRFYHIDLYRLNKDSEISDLGLTEIINDPNNIVAIEWAEKLGKLKPEEKISLSFSELGEDQRKIVITGINHELEMFGKDEKILKAVKILNEGGIVIFPTDTAFGIGSRIDNAKAIARLFKIKQRPKNQAVPILVSGISMAQKFLTPLPDNVRRLMKDYWPGAVTIIYTCKIKATPPLVRGGGNSLGVRQPNHEIALSLIEECGVPILASSANYHGLKTPHHLQELDPKLIKQVDFVLPGECKFNKPSTVIDCTKEPWKIVRQGTIKIDLARYE